MNLTNFDKTVETVEELCKKYAYKVEFSFIHGAYILDLFYKDHEQASFNHQANTINEVYEEACKFLQNYDELSTTNGMKETFDIKKNYQKEKLFAFKTRYPELMEEPELVEKIETIWERLRIGFGDNFERAMMYVLLHNWSLNKIKSVKYDDNLALYSLYKGNSIVEVKPCDKKKYEDKNYIGIYLGDFPQTVSGETNKDGEFVIKPTHNNPLIYIPETNSVVFGSGSWWRKIEKIEDFKGISDEEIQNTWYVQLMKELA